MTYPKCLPPNPDSPVATRDHRDIAVSTLCDNWLDPHLRAWVETGDPVHLKGAPEPCSELQCLAESLAFCEANAKYEAWHEGFDARARGEEWHSNPYRDEHFDSTLMVFWDEDSTYVVARSCEDAALVYAEHVGDALTQDSLEFSLVPGDQDISIRIWVSGPNDGEIAPADEAEQPGIETLRQSAANWAQCFNSRRFLCTTDF